MKPLAPLALALATLAAPLPAQQAIDEMVTACLTDPDHPMRDSDLCQAFLYGIHYQKSRAQVGGVGGASGGTEPGGQIFNRQLTGTQWFSLTEDEYQSFDQSDTLPRVQQFLKDQGVDLDLRPSAGTSAPALTIRPNAKALQGAKSPWPDLQVVQ